MQKAKFILSKSKLLEQYNKVKDAADIVSYSSKTNQEVTKLLGKETGCMFSVHLVNELKHVSDKSRVIFLAQAWNQDEIKSLTDDGIRFFAVDNLPDLDELTKFLGNNNVKVKLLLRMKLKEYTIRTERYFVFGMDSEIINKKVKELRNNKFYKVGNESYIVSNAKIEVSNEDIQKKNFIYATMADFDIDLDFGN